MGDVGEKNVDRRSTDCQKCNLQLGHTFEDDSGISYNVWEIYEVRPLEEIWVEGEEYRLKPDISLLCSPSNYEDKEPKATKSLNPRILKLFVV